VVKKKEESIEDIPQLTMQSMAKRNSILDWTRAAKASKCELLYRIGFGTDDKSNELVELPSIIAKD
jgi:hypothetical protein